MYAYQKDYLYDAMRNLGGMLDFAVNDCLFQMDAFLQMFIISGVAGEFSKGNPAVIAGMSGEELALLVFSKTGLAGDFPESRFRIDRTPEYWCGWILAYTQWKTGWSFHRIVEACPAKELLEMHPVLHEASEQKAADVLLARMRRNRKASQLQRLRSYAGLTQAALAQKSGVSLRSIQMYEQGRKDINKAQAGTLMQLANVFGCDERDLME